MSVSDRKVSDIFIYNIPSLLLIAATNVYWYQKVKSIEGSVAEHPTSAVANQNDVTDIKRYLAAAIQELGQQKLLNQQLQNRVKELEVGMLNTQKQISDVTLSVNQVHSRRHAAPVLSKGRRRASMDDDNDSDYDTGFASHPHDSTKVASHAYDSTKVASAKVPSSDRSRSSSYSGDSDIEDKDRVRRKRRNKQAELVPITPNTSVVSTASVVKPASVVSPTTTTTAAVAGANVRHRPEANNTPSSSDFGQTSTAIVGSSNSSNGRRPVVFVPSDNEVDEEEGILTTQSTAADRVFDHDAVAAGHHNTTSTTVIGNSSNSMSNRGHGDSSTSHSGNYTHNGNSHNNGNDGSSSGGRGNSKVQTHSSSSNSNSNSKVQSHASSSNSNSNSKVQSHASSSNSNSNSKVQSHASSSNSSTRGGSSRGDSDSRNNLVNSIADAAQIDFSKDEDYQADIDAM